jgi:hypothetical protein
MVLSPLFVILLLYKVTIDETTSYDMLGITHKNYSLRSKLSDSILSRYECT